MGALLERVLAYPAAYQRELGASSPGPQGEVGRRVVRTLCEAALEPSHDPPAREPSLFLDGTPIGYSLQLGEAGSPAFRLLVEPGGLAVGLSEQIDFALATLGRIYTDLGWSKSAEPLNRFARGVYPADPAELEGWWGGMWLGCAVADAGFDLRVYMNLRSGTVAARWQRILDILVDFADERFASHFRGLVDRSIEATAVPVGLGLAFAEDRLCGLRLYQGLERAEPDSVERMLEPGWRGHGRREVVEPLGRLVAALGPAAAQSITTAFDFAFRDGRLDSRPRRFKCDLNARRYVARDADRFEEWILSTLTPRDGRRVGRFSALMHRHFGGAELDYVSLACDAAGAAQRTLYVQPRGLAPA